MSKKADDGGKKILELFAGSKSISNTAIALGYETYSSDIKSFEGIDQVIDILEFDYDQVPFIPDIIWASPPCQSFSVLVIGRNWVQDKIFEPKTESARLGIKLVKKTIEIIEYYLELNPDLIWYIENPRGKLRKAPFLQKYIRNTVTYCQYGDSRMKPTDIWTNNRNWEARKMCKNGGNCHTSAPRGFSTGTKGLKNAYESSKIPRGLCIEVLSCL